MLKKIPVHQLRLGMHLHKLEGAWIEHPFWRTKFVIDSAQDLQRLHECGVADCWIDIALGLDVAPPAQPATGASAPPAPDEPAAEAVAAPAEPEYPMSVELKQAAAICSRGREAVVAMFSEVRMGRTVDAEGCMPLVEEISNSVLRNPGAMVSLARLKTKDDYTYMHSVAVCALMISLGRQLGLDEAECRAAGLAGLMHDIGKALMPLEVLNKPGRLTEPEFAIMRSHPVRGHQLLLDGQGCSEPTLDVALHHHERVDGGGYPHRLAGDDIGHFARMGAVCDVYDAITSNRPYKAGWDPAESISRMASWTGHFDKTVFSAFVRSLGIYPTGSLVRLESGRLAVVLEQNPANLVTPVVKVFFSTKSQMPIPAERLDLAQRGCNDRIVGRETRAPGRFEHLEELWVDAETLRRFRR
ncbi:MAG TPA: HD-GYP domain-containing protein [Rubrivivax sp.]|nr:HD-GYP domain-containing protein [Rubrivivax sp.]